LAGTSLACASANAQYAVVSNVAGAFIPNVDVPANLRTINSGSTDDGTALISIPPAYGNNILPTGSAYASTNGRLIGTNDTAYTNVALSATAAKGYYPMWDDLLMTVASAGFNPATAGSGTEGVYTMDTGTVFVVQFNCRAYNAGASGLAVAAGAGYQCQVQIQIYPAPGVGGGTVAQYVYQNLGTITGQSATIGVVHSTPAGLFTQYSQDTAGVISDSTVLTVVAPPGGGACCLAAGGCVVTDSASCTASGGTYTNDNVSCAQASCPAAGACCLPNQTCASITQASCTTQGGAWAGANTSCATTVCPGRCCMTDDTCQILSQASCAAQNGVFGGSNTNCTAVCTGRCCMGDGTCQVIGQASCVSTGGAFGGSGTTCTGFTCPSLGACCAADGTCSTTDATTCATAGNSWRGPNTTCGAAGCGGTGACCAVDGTCSVTSMGACVDASGLYGGDGSACGSANCPHSYAWSGAVAVPDAVGTVCGSGYAEITVPDSFTISEASAAWYMPHTWQGDLSFTLTHIDTGTAVLMVDRPGVPQISTVGFSNDNFGTSTILFRSTDTAPTIYDSSPVGYIASPGVNNVQGNWKSENPLAAFNGQNSAGTWRLSVTDCAGGDVGTLTRFVLNLRGPAGAACYANCDHSTTPPVLNVADFTCFLQKFAAADPYANCDNSTIPPVLNVADFTCFLQKYAAGCSAP
jgi:hypothetical protein